jgi:hypothetical protein
MNLSTAERVKEFKEQVESLTFKLQDIEETMGHNIPKSEIQTLNSIYDHLNTINNLVDELLIMNPLNCGFFCL